MKKPLKTPIFWIFLFIHTFSPPKAVCSLDGEINKFFNEFNTVSNTTDSNYINSQTGVHFLGGHGTVRTKVYDINPIHVQMPSFSAGCGGIDYTLGAINIASKEEMKKALKSIASNSVGYAFLLGIETVSPVISSTMKQIQSWANQLNAININSCEIGSSLVQGVWPKTQRASAYICEHASTTNPLFSDHIQAKHGCRDDKAKRIAAINKVKDNNQDILVGTYNIAWKILENMGIEDEETKNLFMNITGTIVVYENTEDDEEKKVVVYPPKYEKTIETLTLGGRIENAYTIDTENYVDVKTEKPIVIKGENAWKVKIFKTLESIRNKLLEEKTKSDSAWSEEEIKLIRTTHFPISSLITLMTQSNGKAGILSIDLYSNLIAYERVIKFAEDVVKSTIHKAESLRSAQVNGYELDEYIKKVQQVLVEIRRLNTQNNEKIIEQQKLIEFLLNYDRKIREKDRGI